MSGTPTYARRRPEATALHQVVRDNLLTLYAAAEDGFASPLPSFVREELEGFIDCGVLARGFAVLACPDCREQKVVAWSCKGRVGRHQRGLRAQAEQHADRAASRSTSHDFPRDYPGDQPSDGATDDGALGLVPGALGLAIHGHDALELLPPPVQRELRDVVLPARLAQLGIAHPGHQALGGERARALVIVGREVARNHGQRESDWHALGDLRRHPAEAHDHQQLRELILGRRCRLRGLGLGRLLLLRRRRFIRLGVRHLWLGRGRRSGRRRELRIRIAQQRANARRAVARALGQPPDRLIQRAVASILQRLLSCLPSRRFAPRSPP
ncbi:MAG: transposase zinc-binding domain-containing protein [Myxococcales bacterium]|nr:transposase zinc-binding domain-containing protein [Myxococcales bacterium]